MIYTIYLLTPYMVSHRMVLEVIDVTIPMHDPIKSIYVEMVKEIVESEEENDEEDSE